MAHPSQVFCPFRAIGFCSNHIPLASSTQGAECFVVTSVGCAFHVYLCDKLRLLFVGTQQPHSIECLAIQGNIVFASYQNVVKAFKRGQEVNSYVGHEGKVHTILPFVEHLISIDDRNVLKIWHSKSGALYGDVHFDQGTFSITSAAHPSTYLNKILLGSQQGQLQLWNIRINKVIYTFQGWGSQVQVLTQSPAVDVIGVGLENGGVVLHNLKYDETVMKFHQEWGPVTSLSFRTDGINTVATGSPLGHIAVWNLDKKRLATVLRDSHNGCVSGLEFLQSQPLMVTSSPDNTVKVWIFDQSDGSARLLRSRCGHNAPPTKIRFISTGGDAVKILSGGQDNALRVFAVHKDVHMNMELSQGSLVKKSKVRGVRVETLKLPAVTDFAVESARADEWDSVVSCHVGHKSVHTWNIQRYSIGKHTLSSRHMDQSARPQCVTITGCGNYALVGMSSGHIEVFNMQSGLYRGELGRPRAHHGPVRGVAVDSMNIEVFSGSSDNTVKVWSFYEKTLLHRIDMEAPVAHMIYHRDSCMLAVVCDNFVVSIVDTGTKRIVRRFHGHTNRVTDMSFSSDGRWLVTSSMDCSVRTWDIPIGRMIDVFLVESPVTSLALSPTSDFLATTHVDDLGIYLWSNKTMYSHISLRPLPSDYTPTFTDLPTTKITDHEEETNVDGDKRSEERSGETDLEHVLLDSPNTPLSHGLVTLSSLPKSRWSNLQNLDIIKQRNKPVEPPKAPKLAPFFLPMLPGLQPKFVPAEDSEDIPLTEVGGGSKILNLGDLKPLSKFQKCLQQCAQTSEFGPLMKLLKELPPASIDGEFRSLAPESGGSLEWLEQLMRFLLEQLKTNKDFELVESYMGLFLKLHSSVLPESRELLTLSEQLLTEHKKTWASLQRELNMSACLLAYCKSAVI